MRAVLRGLRRDRLLAIIMVVGLGLGVANWQLADVLWREQQYPPTPDSDSLFAVSVRRDVRYERTPDERDVVGMLVDTGLTLRDLDALSVHPALDRSVVNAPGLLAIAPEGGAAEEVAVRFASSGFFEMFDLRFSSGGPYRDGAD